jgi:CBS domain-containing protein
MTMSQAISILLEQARAHRMQAERAIRLAGAITTRDVARRLLDYAQALERLAVEAEERACALIEATAKTRAKSAGPARDAIGA